uniref:Putative DNA or RNA helicases of superfamily II (Modular protein) n=1 Tax=mine drainage metagenome TaxID=410659 RepID=E6PKN5_9ZZZZ
MHATAVQAVGVAVLAAPADHPRPLAPVRAYMASAMENYFDQHKSRSEAVESIRAANAARARGSPKRPMPPPLAPMGVAATVGLGKSRQVDAQVLMAKAAGLPILILTPTHELADEYCHRNPGAVHYFGRKAPQDGLNSTEQGDHTCYKIDPVSRAGDNNHRPAQSLCKTCPNGASGVLHFVRDAARVEKCREFFKVNGLDPAKTPPCHFLHLGLPKQLSAQILVAPAAGFSEAMAIWQEHDGHVITRQAQRLVIVDERTAMAREIDVGPGHVSTWRDRLPSLRERTAKTIARLSRRENLDEHDQDELGKARALLDLLPKIEALFQDLGAWIGSDQALDAERVINLHKQIQRAGASMTGTADWEGISYDADDDEFFIPLRALSTLAQNCKDGTLRQEAGHLFLYEVSPVIEWAIRSGSIIFLDATMSIPMRQLITAVDGAIHEAQAKQNMVVTRHMGHLYARGQVKSKEYPRAAKTYMSDLEKIAAQLPRPAAVITHKSYLRYAQEAHQAPLAALNAAGEFKSKRGVAVGWYGKHERGQNDWKKHHLALVGMPLLSPERIAGLYAAIRAALALAGLYRPEWDRIMDDGKANHGVRLPTQPEVRGWLLDEYAQTVAQAIGRNRAVNHDGPPLTVQLWGGLQSAEFDAALGRYGVTIHDRVQNTVHRTAEDYYNRGGGVDAIDEAVNALLESGATVSRSAVRQSIQAANRAAPRDTTISARLTELRAQGKLPPASAGGRPRKNLFPCIQDLEDMGTGFQGEDKDNGRGKENPELQTPTSARRDGSSGQHSADPKPADATGSPLLDIVAPGGQEQSDALDGRECTDLDHEWAADAVAELERICAEIDYEVELEHQGHHDQTNHPGDSS